MRFVIQVIQADIDKALEEGYFTVRKCPTRWCPVAQAMKRYGFRNPSAGYSYLIFDKPNKQEESEVVNTPAEVTKKMNHFDLTGKMEPFTFEFEV